MRRLEVSCAVRHIYTSLSAKGLKNKRLIIFRELIDTYSRNERILKFREEKAVIGKPK